MVCEDDGGTKMSVGTGVVATGNVNKERVLHGEWFK